MTLVTSDLAREIDELLVREQKQLAVLSRLYKSGFICPISAKDAHEIIISVGDLNLLIQRTIEQ